jgi:phenylpropionate dioxygenase-like ring-hydroxylating dioxygenase large terminal subunit
MTRVVVCPYHAWTYELTGELRAGAQHQGREGFDKRRSA